MKLISALLIVAFVLLGCCSEPPKKDSTFANKGKGIYHKPLSR